MEKLFVCPVCGHVEFGTAPAACPVCSSAREKFAPDAAAIMSAEKEGKEKHVPVITVTNTCGLIPGDCRDIHIKIGSTVHPMAEDHWIMWIDAYVNKAHVARYMLKPALQPAVSIHIKTELKGTLTVIENCNKHGRWMAEASI
jgi:superoxide reductase